jgi:hypothetical protein
MDQAKNPTKLKVFAISDRLETNAAAKQATPASDLGRAKSRTAATAARYPKSRR